MAGLRERKKLAAMRHIQATAVALFEEHGFDAVTVEQVAEAAEVSPSTVYRYFRTKEGLVLHDEHDDMLIQTFLDEITKGTPPLGALHAGIAAIQEAHFHRDREQLVARTRLWATHPGIQTAASLYLDELGAQLAQALAAHGQFQPAEASVVVAAISHGVIAAIRSWYSEGAVEDPEVYIARGLAALGRVLELG